MRWRGRFDVKVELVSELAVRGSSPWTGHGDVPLSVDPTSVRGTIASAPLDTDAVATVRRLLPVFQSDPKPNPTIASR